MDHGNISTSLAIILCKKFETKIIFIMENIKIRFVHERTPTFCGQL